MAEKPISDGTEASRRKDEVIDDMFSHLELNDDELDDVVIGAQEAKEYQKDARWLAIGKVHTNRSFSADALFEKMKSIWNLARDPICREAGENLFIFQMHCLADWKKVVHQGPWTFRGFGLLVEDYDGLSDPEEFNFGGMHVWAQIHGIPELYRKLEVVDDLARRVGKVKEVQMSPKLFYEGNYVRIRVRIDVAKPMLRFTSLSLPEGRKRLPVKYEKVPFFCKRCGLFGHGHEECGDGVWEENQLQYGNWMLATRRVNQPSLAPRRFVPSEPIRGGWAGRGATHQTSNRKRSSEEASLSNAEDLKDTGSSPVKNAQSDELAVEEENDTDARRKLVLANTEMLADGNTMDIGIDGGGTLTPPLPQGYVKQKEKKQRKVISATNANELATSAASSEEDRRAQ
jgi:hypothetical protein